MAHLTNEHLIRKVNKNIVNAVVPLARNGYFHRFKNYIAMNLEKKSRGRPARQWLDEVKELVVLSLNQVWREAPDGVVWRKRVSRDLLCHLATTTDSTCTEDARQRFCSRPYAEAAGESGPFNLLFVCTKDLH